MMDKKVALEVIEAEVSRTLDTMGMSYSDIDYGASFAEIGIGSMEIISLYSELQSKAGVPMRRLVKYGQPKTIGDLIECLEKLSEAGDGND